MPEAGTVETYDNTLIREDLQEAYSMLSPEEVPFQTAIGRKTVTSTLFEWPVVELQDPDEDNRVIEGEDAPGNDAATLGVRLSNYTQISDKRVSVSHTSEAVDAAAEDVQKLAKQLALKLRELKRDMEVMLLSNVAAAGGSTGNARRTAGLPAFLRTNVDRGVSGTNPTLSGTTDGYPNAAAGAGTRRDLTEVVFNDIMTDIWNEGGNTSIVLVNSGNKRLISGTFTGSSTRYKDAIDKRLVNAIDLYTGDFGEVTIVPSRFLPPAGESGEAGVTKHWAVYFLDPEFARIAFLDPVQQKVLAETGHAKSRLIWAEYGLQVDNEKAHGAVYDTLNNPVPAG